MNKILTAFLAIALLIFLLLAPLKPTKAATVFSDNFSSGNFERWSQTYVFSGASQTVSHGIARFIVPTPAAGTNAYSYLVKDGFTSTVNSTIVASQDILVTKVPNGAPQGNGAIFFLYICDSSDLQGNKGNIGIGIDGSNVWSMWIGGNLVYSYVFQTAGSAPVSNTWYHLVLTINNSEGTVFLEVNGVTVIAAAQQQFTDKTHPISLMSGMGEDWWSDGSGQQELDVDNVQLDISDANIAPAPDSTPPLPTSTSRPAHNPTPSPTRTLTDAPNTTTSPSFSSPPLNPTTIIQPGTGITFELTIIGIVILAIVIALSLATLRHKR
jgi:hypothetical protein